MKKPPKKIDSHTGGHLYIAELKIQQSVHVLCCNFGLQICQRAIKADGGGQTRLFLETLAGRNSNVLDRMTGVVLVSFLRELHMCWRATFSKGQTFSQTLKGGKKSARVGKTGRWPEGAAGVSALASTWSCTAVFSAEFLESGFPFRQSAEC